MSVALTSSSSPDGWHWSRLDASCPRRALEHIAHSEISPVTVERLRSGDAPDGSAWRLVLNIPIIVVDTLDAYWAFERVLNKLHSFGKTKDEAKADLVAKLGAHLKLLDSLESPKMAPILKLELEFLRAVLQPVAGTGR